MLLSLFSSFTTLSGQGQGFLKDDNCFGKVMIDGYTAYENISPDNFCKLFKDSMPVYINGGFFGRTSEDLYKIALLNNTMVMYYDFALFEKIPCYIDDEMAIGWSDLCDNLPWFNQTYRNCNGFVLIEVEPNQCPQLVFLKITIDD